MNTSSGRSTPTTADELKEVAEGDAVDFLFAMFVDMHGKPCAKMVPVSAIDGLLSDSPSTAANLKSSVLCIRGVVVVWSLET